MTGPAPTRLTPRQALGWGVAFLVIAILVVLYFVLGREVRPMLGDLLRNGWPQTLS